MPRRSNINSGKQLSALFLNASKSRRLLLLSVGLTLAFVCGLVVVRSADLSAPVILPGDQGIAPAPGMQFNPRVARGGSASLAVWTDNRTVINGQTPGIGSPSTNPGSGSLDDIYAARLDASGNVLDTLPIIVSEAQYNQEQPKVGWNGQNWLVAWQSQVQNNPNYTEIRAARVSPDGTVLDAVPLIITSPLSGNAVTPATVISDGLNWIVMWETFNRSDGIARSVFVARVSPAGVVLDPEGKEAYKHPSQYLDGPDLAFGGDGFLLTFVDIGAGPNFENVLKGVRLSLNLDQNGAPFNISAGYSVGSSNTKLAFNGQYYMVVWANGFTQTTNNKLVGSRISTGGQLLDPSPIQIVANMNDYAPQLDVCGDSSMWFASYESASGPAREVRLARVTADGAPLDANGIFVRAGDRAALTTGVGGGAQVVLHNPTFDPTYSISHVEGARASNAGTVGTIATVSLGVPRQTRPRIAQGSNGYLAVFRSESANDSRILAQRL
ncbi:MAG TPA: hypothetical protein VGC89_05470, partial [Pyrinomonadaceae bacterium]